MCRCMNRRVTRDVVREKHREVYDMHQDGEDTEGKQKT